MDYTLKFPVVRGTQAERDYYIAMVPLGMLSKLFPNEDAYVEPEYRAQRKLNLSRIPIISQYILNNRSNYVFSALAASIDGDFKFISCENADVGILEISMDARFLINDGQHRKSAILAALDEDESLKKETISVVFYEDKGLKRSQQIFTDLNKHAVKTSNSISELYDSRDALAGLTRHVLAKVEFLNNYTDKETDSLGINSPNFFTLNTLYKSNKKIVGKMEEYNKETEEFLVRYWQQISENMIPWLEMSKGELSKKNLRESYIATQGVVMQALGRVGEYCYKNPDFDFPKVVVDLKKINWKRSSKIWKLRSINSNGRVITNEGAVILTANIIKKCIGIPLDDDEQSRELRFKKENLI